MTSELERIKILETKVTRVVDYINKLVGENEKLRQQIKELKTENKTLDDKIKKTEKYDEVIKKYEEERVVLQDKIEAIIHQIDEIGI